MGNGLQDQILRAAAVVQDASESRHQVMKPSEQFGMLWKMSEA